MYITCGSGSKKAQGDKPSPDSQNTEVQLNEDAQIGEETGLWGPDSITTVKNYSLYREFYKQKMYDDALPYWKYVIENAPKARKTPYVDGIKMYREKLKAASDGKLQQAYLDTLIQLYDTRVGYFGEEGYISGLKAMLYKKYRPDDEKAYYDMILKTVQIEQEESPYYVILPYFKIKLQDFSDKILTRDQIFEEYDMLSDIVSHNVQQKHEKADKYEEQQTKLDIIADKLRPKEPTKTVTSCPDIKQVYEPEYRANPNDLTTVKMLYSRLVRAKCTNDPLLSELQAKLYELEPTASRARRLGNMHYKNGNTAEAVRYFKQAIELETDRTKQATMYMNLATIERRSVDNLTTSVAVQARKYAKKAAELRPGWGKPYVFIGDLYASSGKLCGPGTGWDSQVVTWPAVDMWQKAKNIDPSVAAEAQKNINRYAQFYPTVGEGHMRGVSKGQRYSIGCWIGTKTTARLR